MNVYTMMIREAADCSVEEALELQDLMEREWLIEKWSRASEREIRSATRKASALLELRRNR